MEGEERITRKRVVFRPSVSLKQKIEAMSLDRIAADGSFVDPDGEGAGEGAGDQPTDGPTHNEGGGSHTEQEVTPETGGDTGKLG